MLNESEVQTAVYQHDMRHHLNAIDGFLAAGKPQQAEEYIRKVRSDIERITPKRYCDNELVNLLCSSFAGKAQRMGVRLEVDAKLPLGDRTVRVPRTGRHLFHAARAADQSGGEKPRLTQEAAADAAASFFRPREAKN